MVRIRGQMSRSAAEKQCLLVVRGLSSRAQGLAAGLACKRKSRQHCSTKKGGAPLLAEELLSVNGFQERGSLFSLRMWPLVVEP